MKKTLIKPRLFSNKLEQKPKPQNKTTHPYYLQIYNHSNKNYYQERVF